MLLKYGELLIPNFAQDTCDDATTATQARVFVPLCGKVRLGNN